MPQDPWAAFPVVPGIEGEYEQSVINSPTTAPAPVVPAVPVTGVTSAANAPIYQGGTSIDTLGRLGDEPEIAQIQAPAIDNNLIMTRARFSQEMQQNPDLRRKFMASINAEVGSQGPSAQQAYAESVLNRAASRGLSLNTALSSKYYPISTTSKLGDPMSPAQQNQFNPIINNALSGSNISNLATGNESANLRTLPVTFTSQGERFGVESADKGWVRGMTRIAQQAPTPAPTPTLQPKLTPTQLLAQYNSIAGKVSPSIYQPVFRPYQPTQAQPLL